MPSNPLADTQPVQRHGKPWRWLLWLFLAVCLIALSSASGALAGYWSGRQEASRQRIMNAAIAIEQQYLLGLEDMRAGRYDIARQRFEYVLSNDPSFPGVADKLAEAMRILYATATPSPIPPSATPSPTPDMAPLEEIYARVVSAFQSGDWDGVINNVLALRQRDLTYRVVAVDDMLYQALRNRGVARISRGNDLQGGNYDLSLAERFGPVDAVAQNWRNLARLYLIGSGFWEVDPAQAVYYFGMVAAAAPYLRDASGWTASERYRASLIQYGDYLAARGDVCAAQDQYNLALSYRRDASLESRATAVAAQCVLATQVFFTPTATLAFTPTPTETPTLVLTTVVPATTPVPPTSTFTPTAPLPPTVTPTSTSLPSPTTTPQASDTPTPPTPAGG